MLLGIENLNHMNLFNKISINVYLKLFTLIFLFCLTINTQYAQLIDGGFESKSSCPSSFGQSNLLNHWYSPTNAAVDYFDTCGYVPPSFLGLQEPYSGSGFIGLSIGPGTTSNTLFNYRDYIQNQLPSPLLVGGLYHLKMYVSIPEPSRITTDAIGGLLSTTPVTQYNDRLIERTPQISNMPINFITEYQGWQLIEMEFVSDSAYEYLTIGNFLDDAAMNRLLINPSGSTNFIYFYIDNVSLTVDNFVSIQQQDTILCLGDSIELSVISSDSVKWISDSNPNVILSEDLSFWVYPNNSSTYTAFNNFDTSMVLINIYGDNLDLGNDTTICKGNLLILNAGPTIGGYLWQDNSTEFIYVVNETGQYWVEKTDGNCIAYDSIYVEVLNCTGINSNTASEIIISPNPSNGFFTIDFQNDFHNNMMLILYDTRGKVLKEQRLLSQITPIDINDFSKGVYFIQIIENGIEKEIVKIIKQ